MRIVKRLTHVLVLVLTLVIGATAAAVIVSQTAWFKNWLRGYIVRQANLYLNGTLSIERLGGNLFFGIEMENIGVSMDGSQVVAVKDLGLDYSVFQLLTKGLSVDSIRLDQPVIYLRREGDTWSLSRLVKKQETEADRRGPAYPIAIDTIGIANGSVVVESPVGTSGVQVPKRLDHLDAKLSFNYEPVRYSIEISHVSFRGSEPALAVNALSGGIAVRDDTVFVEKLALRTAESSVSVDGAVQQYLSSPILNLEISSDKLSLPEIARLVPALSGVTLQPSFNVKAEGPLDSLKVEMNVQSSAGELSGTVTANVAAATDAKSGQPMFARGEVSVKHLDLSPILNDPRQKSDITANARFDLQSRSLSNIDTLHGTASIDSPRMVAAGYVAEKIHAKARVDGRRVALDGSASAYGAAATVAGNIVAAGRQGAPWLRRSRRCAARRFAASPAGGRSPARGHQCQRRLSRRRISRSGGSRTPRTRRPSLRAVDDRRGEDRHREHRRLRRQRRRTSQLPGATRRSPISTCSASAPNSVSPRWRSIATRARSTGTSSPTGAARRRSRWTSRPTAPSTTRRSSAGESRSSRSTPRSPRDTLHVKAVGTFADVDPAVASGKPELAGTVAGSVDVDATVTNLSTGVTPDSVQADANIALQPSRIGSLDITRGNLEGSYHDSVGDIRVLDVAGHDVNVQASGTLALNDTGQSNLKVHADTPSLEQVGKLVNQPLAGIAKIDATITGNKQQLQATGNLTGNGVKYGDNGALTIVVRLHGEGSGADGGRRRRHGEHPRHIRDGVGPEHQRARRARRPIIRRRWTSMRRRNSRSGRWRRTARCSSIRTTRRCISRAGPDSPGRPVADSRRTARRRSTTPTTRSRSRNLELVNGDQKISAEGTFGRPGDALKVTLDNIDVASVDALLLRPPQLSGRLNARPAPSRGDRRTIRRSMPTFR